MMMSPLFTGNKSQKVMRECKLFAPISAIKHLSAHFRDLLVGISAASDSLAAAVRRSTTIGKSGCAKNAAKSHRRRQLCLTQSKPSWPLACSQLLQRAHSKKKSSWSSQSRSCKSQQWTRCNSSIRSGANGTRPNPEAPLSGGCPC